MTVSKQHDSFGAGRRVKLQEAPTITRDEWELGGADEWTISLGMGLGDFAVVASVEDEPSELVATHEAMGAEANPAATAEVSRRPGNTEGTAVGPPRPRQTSSSNMPAVSVGSGAGARARDAEREESTEVSRLPMSPDTPNAGVMVVGGTPDESLAEIAAASALQESARTAVSMAWRAEVAERTEVTRMPDDAHLAGPDTGSVYDADSTFVADDEGYEEFDGDEVLEGELIEEEEGEGRVVGDGEGYDETDDITDVELTLSDIEMADSIARAEAPFNPALLASFGQYRGPAQGAASEEEAAAEADLVEAAIAAAERASAEWMAVESGRHGALPHESEDEWSGEELGVYDSSDLGAARERTYTDAMVAAMASIPDEVKEQSERERALRAPAPPKMVNRRRSRQWALAAMLVAPLLAVGGYLIYDASRAVPGDVVAIPAPEGALIEAPTPPEEGDPTPAEVDSALPGADGRGPGPAWGAVGAAVEAGLEGAEGALPVVETPRPE
jgi:hypothetical protein